MVTSRAGQVDLGAVLGRGAVAADPDAVERDRELLGLEGGVGGADRGQHPAPVGVLAVDGALEQVAAGHRPADRHGVGLAVAARATSTAMLLVAPSASSTSCRARSAQTGSTAASSASSPGVDAGRAGGQQQHGVVGGHAAVGVDPVEGRARSPAAAPRRAGRPSTTASVVRTTSMVASPGASMPAPLAMPPTGKPPAPTATDCLGTDVGGHDRAGRVVGAGHGEQRHGRVDAGEQPVDRQPLADQAGRADRDVAGRHAERHRDPLGGGVGVLEARPGRCRRWRRRS